MLFTILLGLAGAGAQAEPYTPEPDDVLTTLPPSVAALSVPAPGSSAIDRPATDDERIDAATRYLQLAYETNDPRAFGYAEAQLRPWWNETDAPPRVKLMKATILQHNHRFEEALSILDRVVEQQPRNAQARLMRAQVYIAGASYEQARSECRQLAGLAGTAIAANCLAQVRSLTGEARESLDMLARLAAYDAYFGAVERLEIKITQATIARRLGMWEQAEGWFREALAQDPASAYLLTQYVGLLLQQTRPVEVIERLEALPEWQRTLELEVRLLQAYELAGHAAAAGYRNYLQEKFDTAMARAESLPHKEYALFALHSLDRPDLAVEAAARNWRYQKAPGDAYLLLRAANAAGDQRRTEEIARWVRQHGLEDQRISALLDGTE